MNNGLSGSLENSTMKNIDTIAPVGISGRVASIDVLRGFALLGILVINIEFFALPGAIYFNPTVAGGFAGINLLTWGITSTFFLQKMMGIFSMLFGAGLVLMFDRFSMKGVRFGGLFYRRILWLLLIGLFHSYLIWYGDILVTYAICGLLLFLFRRLSPKVLIILSVIVFLIGMLIQLGSGFMFGMLKAAAVEVETARTEGQTVPTHLEDMAEAWAEIDAQFSVTDEDIVDEVKAYRGGYFSNLSSRVPETLMMQTQALIFMMFWRVMGLMLLGMALMKLNFFSAIRSMRFYITLAVIGYVIGLPLSIIGSKYMIAYDFDIIHVFKVGNQLKYVGGIMLALAHASLVMAICKAGLFARLRRLLANVGRTALSNYLLQSFICTTLFYGFGFGLFNRLERFPLMGIVVAVWIVQLIISCWWLNRFRFGPAEWIWRSLTYWRRQPMRIS